MKVKIIAYTNFPEETIAKSAKLCYSRVGVDEISEKLDEDSTNNFLNMLMSLSHLSPLEHASFTFAVEGVSRTLTHQLVRHRIASYSQQSQRYVRLDHFEYIIPPQIEKNERAREIYIKAMEEDQRAYSELVDILVEENSRPYIEKGMTREKAIRNVEKLSIEDARYVFPNACETKIVFTMNVRTLLHFFSLRCCNRAQWEIKQMATEMLRQLKELSPILFENAGPGCVNGPCPEGKMTCGRAKEVREFFKGLGEK
ncbi:FAD-dependent thymidylate synthase [uncultured Peptoniphilus sp.]|uniref:FAD-dependent thymidylate synthase n=1 Tax=uncultured Peptoniphilus sp. TaxID=254354 RepID=UPI002805745D|nr:FAD-dependent thymidylate synthase [uncultured Peptoniphilus sp.]